MPHQRSFDVLLDMLLVTHTHHCVTLVRGVEVSRPHKYLPPVRTHRRRYLSYVQRFYDAPPS